MVFFAKFVLKLCVLCQVVRSLTSSFDNRTVIMSQDFIGSAEDPLMKRKKEKQVKPDSRFLKLGYLSQDINVGFEFGVPVFQVPIYKTANMTDIQSFIAKGLGPITINIGALILAVVVFIGALLAHLFLNYKPLYLVHLIKTFQKGWKRY